MCLFVYYLLYGTHLIDFMAVCTTCTRVRLRIRFTVRGSDRTERPKRKVTTFGIPLSLSPALAGIPNTLSSPAVASVTSSRSPIYGLFMFLPIFFVLAIPIVLGQNYTACNPTTNSNCPPIPGFSSATTSFNFSSTYPERDFTLFSENTITQDGGGLHIIINAVGEYPYIETNSTVSPGSFLSRDPAPRRYSSSDLVLTSLAINSVNPRSIALPAAVACRCAHPSFRYDLRHNSNHRLSILWQSNGYNKIYKRDNDRDLFQP